MHTKRLFQLVVVLAGSILSSVSCLAASSHATQPDEWWNSFTLYLWLPAQSGTVVIRGNPASVDTSISDAWDALSNLEGGFTGHYEGGKGPWTIIADLCYVKLQDDVRLGMLDVTYEPKQTIAEIAGAYTVSRVVRESGSASEVQVLSGFRYMDLGLDLRAPGADFSASGDQDWVDFFIGARALRDLSRKWAFSVRGDIGGFGIGSSSDLTWNVVVDFRNRLSERWALDFGWRWLDYDFGTGSGLDEFGYDVLSNGPFVGLTYQW